MPEGFKYVADLGGKELTIETGKYAKQVSGSVWLSCGGTVVMATVQAGPSSPELDFLPLTVEYEERHYAVGKIPGSFMRREGRPGERAILSARLTDRPIRPLFPAGFRAEVQVILTVLSADQETNPDILGPIAASAALSLSDIPWQGPIGAVRVGYVDGQLIINPTFAQLEVSKLDLVVAGTAEAILMVEAGAQEVSEDLLAEALDFGHRAIKPLVDVQLKMQAELGKPKREVLPAPALSPEELAELWHLARSRGLAEVLTTASKHERSGALADFETNIVAEQVASLDEAIRSERERLYHAAFEEVIRLELRRLVLEEGRRADGRGTRDIRPIWIETDVLPRAHGSAVFTRGETQVLGVATLGTGRDEQIIDDLGVDLADRFLVHYNFPPYATGEAKRLRGVSRREIGHGNLAKRALKPVLPSREEFPYTLRVVGDVLESNGSSSMATTCAGCLALMDAGVPIKKMVAGVAMGLVLGDEQSAILTDILGIEDHLGDMDFKVTGTRDGVTALQMDIKVFGISRTLMREALAQAKEARNYILDRMSEVITAPRSEFKSFVPRIVTLRVPVAKIGAVIGPGGKNIRALEELGVSVDIDPDGLVKIYSADATAAEAARAQVAGMVQETKVGETYQGTVTRVTNFGAFVAIFPGTEGLLHISQIAEGRVERVEDHLNVGDVVKVKVNKIDERGRIDLIRPELEGKIPVRRAPRGSE